MSIADLSWIHGIPGVTAIADHAVAHPLGSLTDRRPSGLWLIVDDGSSTVPRMASLARLSISQEDDFAYSDTGKQVPVPAGRVMIANGLCFWQELALCRWAARSRYRPCTSEGIPVDLLR